MSEYVACFAKTFGMQRLAASPFPIILTGSISTLLVVNGKLLDDQLPAFPQASGCRISIIISEVRDCESKRYQ